MLNLRVHGSNSFSGSSFICYAKYIFNPFTATDQGNLTIHFLYILKPFTNADILTIPIIDFLKTFNPLTANMFTLNCLNI